MAEAPASCPVCNAKGMFPIYNSDTATSLSSLCQILPGSKIISYCENCGHLAANGVADSAAFYETDYRILLDEEDEDQIYQVRGDEIITRTDHQMTVLTGKIPLDSVHKILDFGCAKAAMARKITEAKTGIDMHLFDVSRMYEPFWDKFVSKDRQAINQIPDDWNGKFDLVTSFFAFEHITEPAAAIAHVAQLLKPGGQFYMIVPDVTGNAADFIVVDHVNHFTRPSAERLMADAGFGEIEVDTQSHRGALIVTGRKDAAAIDETDSAAAKAHVLAHARELAEFWSKAAATVRANEAASPPDAKVAIYGSGFYGAFIQANLERPEATACFLDRSPWRQGRMLFDVPIIASADMPEGITTVYAGLNPMIAHDVIRAQPWAKRHDLRIVYLKEPGK
ncbi:class I SAM-dependent methyltransferase [Hoeflea alexandrii]|uniref:class I SAM-dependent methyltransferase n=1 Tax=Hoeflea alexandrii TaxID=288436 RepID=UPI0035CF9D55